MYKKYHFKEFDQIKNVCECQTEENICPKGNRAEV